MSRLRIRALHPFKIRKRYIRGSTSRNGQTLPLTSMVSPKYSPIQVAPGDVAGRVPERPVRVELAVLDDQRDLVGPAGDPDRVGLLPGVVLRRGGCRRRPARRRRSAGWLPGRGRGTRAARPASGAAGWYRRRSASRRGRTRSGSPPGYRRCRPPRTRRGGGSSAAPRCRAASAGCRPGSSRGTSRGGRACSSR